MTISRSRLYRATVEHRYLEPSLEIEISRNWRQEFEITDSKRLRMCKTLAPVYGKARHLVLMLNVQCGKKRINQRIERTEQTNQSLLALNLQCLK